jgi:ATP-dependent Clp protease adapter protein ClpS
VSSHRCLASSPICPSSFASAEASSASEQKTQRPPRAERILYEDSFRPFSFVKTVFLA